MGVSEVIGYVFSVLSQLGLLTVVQAVVILLVAAAVVNYFVKR